MKRFFGFSAFIIIMLLGLTQMSLACKITYEPEKIEGLVGEKKTVKIELKWEHRRCVLDEYDTNMEFKGISLIEQQGWEKIRSMLYKNVVTVRLDEPGDAKIRVYRECSKKGLSEGILKIKINQTFKGALKDIAEITLDMDKILKKKEFTEKDETLLNKLYARLEAERKWLLKNSPETEDTQTLLAELDKVSKALKKKEFEQNLLTGLKKHKLLIEELEKILAKREAEKTFAEKKGRG